MIRHDLRGTAHDVVQSALAWHIWTRMGIQDVRLKFRRSMIGVGWVFMNLAVMVGAIGFIYSNLLGQNARQFVPYLTLGFITWQYLTSAIVDGGNAFVNAVGYVKQISLPIYVYLFRFFFSITLISALNYVVFVVVVVLFGVPVGPGTLLAIPGLIMVMAAALLFVTIFAHLNARFRDVAHLASVGMQVLFYVTPVMFPADLLRGRRLAAVVDYNPLFHLLEVVRQPLLTGAPAPALSYAVVGLLLAVLTVSAAGVIAFFQRRIVFAL